MRTSFTREGGQVARFLIVGGICVFTYYFLFIGLTELGIWYIVSAIVAFVVYYAVHFLLQKYWTFKNKDRKYVKQQLAQFTVVSVGNWIVNTSLLYVLVEYLGMWYVIAQGLLTILVTAIAYFCFRWIFRHR